MNGLLIYAFVVISMNLWLKNISDGFVLYVSMNSKLLQSESLQAA